MGVVLGALVLTGGTPLPHKEATFAGGCFWCMEPPFEKIAGVIDVVAR